MMTVPTLMRVPADGSARAERLATGRFKQRQPHLVVTGSASRSCRRTARRSRWSRIAPNPTESDVVLQFFDPSTKKIERSRRSPRSRRSATRTRRGGRTASTCSTSATVATARAARRSSSATTSRRRPAAHHRPGLPRARRTRRTAGTSRRPRPRAFGTTSSSSTRRTAGSSCGSPTTAASWAPVWSPAGDAIAFLHIEGQIVDLRLVRLDGDGAELDGQGDDHRPDRGLRPRRASRPDWFVPAEQLPARRPRRPPSPSAATAPTRASTGARP